MYYTGFTMMYGFYPLCLSSPSRTVKLKLLQYISLRVVLCSKLDLVILLVFYKKKK